MILPDKRRAAFSTIRQIESVRFLYALVDDPDWVKDIYEAQLDLGLIMPDKVLEDVETQIPYMKRGGGYIFATDHSVPDNVDLEEFKKVIDWVKELGRY